MPSMFDQTAVELKPLVPQFLYPDGAAERVDLGAGYVAVFALHCDVDMREPWKEHDGHGDVSEWRPLDSKQPGELVLCVDRRQALFYDFAGAVRKARSEGWGAKGDEGMAPGAKAAHAARADFERMRGWCRGEWRWIGASVSIERDGAEVQAESLWGFESDGDYWQDVCAELLAQCLYAEKKARAQALRDRRESRRREAMRRCFL